MTNQELISILLAHEPTAQVMLMTQRKQPFENHLTGVVARREMSDQLGRVEAGIATSDVFLVVGKRIRPGSLSAWTVAERRQAIAYRDAETTRNAVLAIARNLCASSFESSADDLCWERSGVVRALYAAYEAGCANTAAFFTGATSADLNDDAVDGEEEDDPEDAPAQAGPRALPAAEEP